MKIGKMTALDVQHALERAAQNGDTSSRYVQALRRRLQTLYTPPRVTRTSVRGHVLVTLGGK